MEKDHIHDDVSDKSKKLFFFRSAINNRQASIILIL
jgi:hypothetical protein